MEGSRLCDSVVQFACLANFETSSGWLVSPIFQKRKEQQHTARGMEQAHEVGQAGATLFRLPEPALAAGSS